jgi:formamidopyrimidine-DNA glycosylase
MPELPEVETIRTELLPWVLEQQFVEINILDSKLVQGMPSGELQRLVGKSVKNLERRGKYLIFHLSNNEALIMHLRMTGNLTVNPEIGKYSRAFFLLANGTTLVFNDKRRLGVIYLVENAETIVGKLGVEPLSEFFTQDGLLKLMRKHQIPIKAALLDQSIIAGIGNMYADESLFNAGIHPLALTSTLSRQEVSTLFYSIRSVLSMAVSNKGASVDTYVRPDGELGSAQSYFRVAHRKGQSCYVCGTPIQRLMLRGRGSYFCPICQSQ